jgi:ubiquinone/menaquinone biosynthesis C-methylase UbiE
MDIWTSTDLTNSFLRGNQKMTKRRRTSRKSLGREGHPHGGNGLGSGIAKMIRQLKAHELGKKTKLLDHSSGKMKIVDKAGNDKTHTDYLILLAKARKRKEKNAKGSSKKQ